MTTVIFTNNYSDLNGSYRTGWKCSLPDELAKQLIDSGTATLAPVEPPAGSVEQPVIVTPPKLKRTRRPKLVQSLEQYVAPSTPEM